MTRRKIETYEISGLIKLRRGPGDTFFWTREITHCVSFPNNGNIKPVYGSTTAM